MHGREIRHIIAKKRARKASPIVEQPIAPTTPIALPLHPSPTPLEIDLEAAWACFCELDGPHTLWRIHTLIERGVSSRVFGIRGPKHEILHLDTIEDIVRIVKSRARKGRDRYEYKPYWFDADSGQRTKKKIHNSHRDLTDSVTDEALYTWLKHMNEKLSTGLGDLVAYYETEAETPSMVDGPTRIQALMRLDQIRERRKRAARYMRVRQTIRLTTDYAFGGGWSNQPKRSVPRKGSRTRLKGWETPKVRNKKPA